MKRTTNLIEMSEMYDDGAYMWFLNNEEFPSKAEYRDFTVNNKDWISWANENVDISSVNHRIKSNDTQLK